mmetsp:Transcript_17644/g.27656  ORF Transcript_17644/g.27656 Transcript_17644/m.27656 type:complete len:165 (-) Transcript_17644:285-779(-)|eukprot:CAMPEP_0201725064 /NCGR_PEP_ID=MMETSP0593-20130828/8579_1 /ASSEMBLY_ACC=CAM_ASM_000672 /TAXON_ID=267983 /ORGANISM="Skeletonema japonicum, Strain CCMP2506" /LENGTH=164 /DNA_ID=CAMNT_0048216383 /DNA_START=40 /DNA_END=534 /DNA_ORIENTATION=+
MASASIMFANATRRSMFQALRSSSRLSSVSSPSFGSARFMTTYYTPAHEYCKVDGNVATVGITDFAQAALGDIVFVDLPEPDDEFEAKDSFGSVESVKAASDVYAPVSGKVLEVNETLSDEPALVNTSAEDEAWFIKLEITDESELSELMGADAYKEHCEKEAH